MLTRFAAFRNQLYARMEEISFRTSLTVLTGVAAVAAVIAGVGLLMSQSPAPARPVALSPAPASHSALATPPPAAATPSPSAPVPTPSAPDRTPAPVKTSLAREATYPATAENSAPVRNAAAAPRTAPVRRSASSAVAAWLAWWQQVLASHRGGGPGIGRGGQHWGWR
jgi:hypothetical protein